MAIKRGNLELNGFMTFVGFVACLYMGVIIFKAVFSTLLYLVCLVPVAVVVNEPRKCLTLVVDCTTKMFGGNSKLTRLLKDSLGGSCHFIGDNFKSASEVSSALRSYGLESCELIVGVDFTKSNEWSGQRTFGKKSLHHLKKNSLQFDLLSLHTSAKNMNPYQYVLALVCRTLSNFDDDNRIHAYGFGDSKTMDEGIFSFQPSGGACAGLEDVLGRYHDIASSKSLKLSGPTSFVPLIHQAIDIVSKTGKFHILVIIADGQVSDESLNADAVVEASKYPISIVVIGVGDGPWDAMEKFDDQLPKRDFDNFQFVEFSAIIKGGNRMESSKELEAKFALNALMETPFQYEYMKKNGMLGQRNLIPCRPEVKVEDPPDARGKRMYPDVNAKDPPNAGGKRMYPKVL
jgi:E3 ubiquitin-protein ligase RGLG